VLFKRNEIGVSKLHRARALRRRNVAENGWTTRLARCARQPCRHADDVAQERVLAAGVVAERAAERLPGLDPDAVLDTAARQLAVDGADGRQRSVDVVLVSERRDPEGDPERDTLVVHARVDDPPVRVGSPLYGRHDVLELVESCRIFEAGCGEEPDRDRSELREEVFVAGEQAIDDAHGDIRTERRERRLVQGAAVRPPVRCPRGRPVDRDESMHSLVVARHVSGSRELDEFLGDGDLPELGARLECGRLGGRRSAECEEPAVPLAAHGLERDGADPQTDPELDPVVALGKPALRLERCPAGRDRGLGIRGPVRHERVAGESEHVASCLGDDVDQAGEAAVEDRAQLLDCVRRVAHRERQLRESTDVGGEDDALDVFDSEQRLPAAQDALPDDVWDEAPERVRGRHRVLGGGGAGGW
jgi:hypothetical protein